jgi:hypothetical protein
MVDKTTKIGRMGRRKFMEFLAGIGLSSTVVQNISADELQELTDDPTERVPRAKGYRPPEDLDSIESIDDLEIEYYTIPRDQWIVVETAKDAARRVQEKIDEIEGADGVRACVSTKVNNHRRQKAISVEIPRVKTRTNNDEENSSISGPDITKDDLKYRLPDEMAGSVGRSETPEAIVEGIPIHIEETITFLDHSCGEKSGTLSHYNFDYPDVPGGANIKVPAVGSDATSCAHVYDYDKSDYRMLTAGHLLIDTDGESEPDYAGEGRYWSQSTTVGSAEEVHCFYASNRNNSYPMDVAILNTDQNNKSLSSKVAKDDRYDMYDEELYGTAHSDYVSDLEFWGKKVTKQGRKTGRCSGVIDKYSDDEDNGSLIALKKGGSTGVKSDSGDSCGIYFHTDNDGDTYVVALHYGSNEDSTGSVAMYSIINQYPLAIF